MASVSNNQIEESTPMPVLPRDIIVDVLSRLPVKSLLRFKCVCKPWCSLISHPQFIKMHLNNNRQRCLISTEPLQSIDVEAADDAAAAKLLNHPLAWELQLVGSARGLVCLVIDFYYIFIWNPNIWDAKELRKPKLLPKYPENNPVLVFGSALVFGFGYDSSIDDYKVVRLTRDGNSNNHLETKGEVYSLKTNSWKRIQNIHPSARLLDGHGIFLNGALHWLVNYGNATLSFDLATEKFQEVVPLPDCDVRTRPIGDIGVLGGCLSLWYRNGNYLELWEMKEYGVKASWTKSVTISLEKLLPDKKPPYHNRWSPLPLCFSKNGEVLMNVDGTELIMYNLKEETFRKLSIHGQNWNTLETVIYVESLVSPKDISGAEKRLQGQQRVGNRWILAGRGTSRIHIQDGTISGKQNIFHQTSIRHTVELGRR